MQSNPFGTARNSQSRNVFGDDDNEEQVEGRGWVGGATNDDDNDVDEEQDDEEVDGSDSEEVDEEEDEETGQGNNSDPFDNMPPPSRLPHNAEEHGTKSKRSSSSASKELQKSKKRPRKRHASLLDDSAGRGDDEEEDFSNAEAGLIAHRTEAEKEFDKRQLARSLFLPGLETRIREMTEAQEKDKRDGIANEAAAGDDDDDADDMMMSTELPVHSETVTIARQHANLWRSSDPPIWSVEVKAGNEMQTILNLTRKLQDCKAKGMKLRVSSMYCTATPGVIYLESFNEIDSRTLIDGMNFVKAWKLRRLLPNEILQSIQVKPISSSSSSSVRPGQWIRVSRGTYKGDLCRILHITEGGSRAIVQIIPRLSLELIRMSTTDKAEWRKNNKGKRPDPKKFDAAEVRNAGGRVEDVIEPQLNLSDCCFFDDEYFWKGFLILEIKTATMLDLKHDVKASMDEMAVFDISSSLTDDERNVLDDAVDVTIEAATTASTASVNTAGVGREANADDDEDVEDDDDEEDMMSHERKLALKLLISPINLNEAMASSSSSSSSSSSRDDPVPLSVDDKIRVIEDGDLHGLTGTIVSIDKRTRMIQVKPDGGLSENVQFGFSAVEKHADPGAHVKVLRGQFSGETGMIVSLKPDVNGSMIATIITDRVNNEIHAPVSVLHLTTEVASGMAMCGKYSLYDMVLFNQTEVGTVVHVGRLDMLILTHRNEERSVKPIDIMGKMNQKSDKSIAFDVNGKPIKNGDMVNVAEARSTTSSDGKTNLYDYRHKSATVKHVHRSFLFVHSASHATHSGIYAVRANQCSVVGGLLSSAASSLPPNLMRGGGRNGGRGRGAGGRGGGRMGKNDDADVLGKTGRISKGDYKGLIGVILHANNHHYTIELHAKMKTVYIEKASVVILDDSLGVNANRQDYNSSSSSSSSGYSGSSERVQFPSDTPYVTAKTPSTSFGPNTPFLTSETPRDTQSSSSSSSVFKISSEEKSTFFAPETAASVRTPSVLSSMPTPSQSQRKLIPMTSYIPGIGIDYHVAGNAERKMKVSRVDGNFLILVEVDHPESGRDVRVSCNSEDISFTGVKIGSRVVILRGGSVGRMGLTTGVDPMDSNVLAVQLDNAGSLRCFTRDQLGALFG